MKSVMYYSAIVIAVIIGFCFTQAVIACSPPPGQSPIANPNPGISQNNDPTKDPNGPTSGNPTPGDPEDADPVRLVNGKFAYSVTDMVIKGRKLDVAIQRSYQNDYTTSGTYQFTGSGSDPDGSITQYSWFFPPEAYDISDTSTSTPSCKFTVPETYGCLYKVRDNSGLWSSDVYFEVTAKSDDKTSRFGYDWDMNYNQKVIKVDEDSITFCDGQCHRIGYTKVSGSSPAKYVGPAYNSDYILKENNLFTLYKKDGTKYKFDSDGCLWRIEDRNGNTIIFGYDGYGLYKALTTITDDLNRNITLAYNDDGLLSTVTDFSGRTWTYTYNSSTNNLLSVTTPGSPGLTTQYTYDSKHNLQTIIDPDGQTWLANNYNALDKVITQTLGGLNYTFSYDPDNNKTTVTDRRDIETIHEYDDSGNILRTAINNENSDGCLTSSFQSTVADVISHWAFEDNLPGYDCSPATVITTAAQLQDMSTSSMSGCYVLGNDIDASTISNFVPIGTSSSPFTGNFDGRGYTITGLYIDRPTTEYVGLFGKVTLGTNTIKNVRLENVDITGQKYVGGLVGYCNSGTITKCYTSGIVNRDVTPPSLDLKNGDIWDTMPYVYYDGSIYYYHIMKAIAATDTQSPPVKYQFACVQGGSISSVWITGTPNTSGTQAGGYWSVNSVGVVTFTAGGFTVPNHATYEVHIKDAADNQHISQWVNTLYGPISEKPYHTSNSKQVCGGLVGYSKGTLSQCSSSASVSGYKYVGGFVGQVASGSVTNCYSAGSVTGTLNTGGFCGTNSGTITDCFWDTQTALPATTSSGGTGKTTSLMKQLETFTNASWDFDTIWGIDTGISYPYILPGSPITDSVGGNNGMAFVTGSVAGNTGNAFSFSHNGERVCIKDSANLDLDKFTISAWIYKDSNTDYAGIITKCDASSPVGYNFNMAEDNTGRIVISFCTGSTLSTLKSVTSTDVVSLGAWHYVMATNDDNYLRLYIDGVEAGTADAIGSGEVPNIGERHLYIGCAYNNGSIDKNRSFKGKIDEVKIYEGVTATNEVQESYSFLSSYITNYGYNSTNGLLERIIYPAGNCTDFGYDSSGNTTLVKHKPAPGTESPYIASHYAYNNFGFVQTYTDPRSNITTYGYNSTNGNLNSITFPMVPTDLGNAVPVVGFTYNSQGQVETITAPDGIVTKYEYYTNSTDVNNFGHIWKVIQDYGTSNITTEYVYDKVGRVIRAKDPLANITNFAYNELDQVVKTTTPLGNVTEMSYNGSKMLSQIESTKSDGNQITKFYYNIMDKLENNVNPLNKTTHFDYDNSQNLLRTTDAQNRQTLYGYDVRDNLASVTDANNNTTQYCYNENGLLAKIADANERGTWYEYDNFDRLKTITYTDGSEESFEYDDASNITSYTNRAGQTITYTYDALNRMQTKTRPQGAISAISPVGHWKMNDMAANTIVADSGNGNDGTAVQNTSVLSTPGKINNALNFNGTSDYVTCSSSNLNNLAVFDFSGWFKRNNSGTVQGLYYKGEERNIYIDTLNRIAAIIRTNGDPAYALSISSTTITDTAWHFIRCYYDHSGDRQFHIYVDNVEVSYACLIAAAGDLLSDASNSAVIGCHNNLYYYSGLIDDVRIYDRVLSDGEISYLYNSGSGIEDDLPDNITIYTYDIAGRLLEAVENTDDATSYFYDRLGRLEEVVDAETRSVSYEYDAAGRRTSLTYPDNTEVTYEYDADSRLTVIRYGGSIIAQYAYDQLGRRTLLTYGNNTSITYQYDLGNRLTQIINSIGGDFQYGYDDVGNRLSKTIGGNQDTYTYDEIYRLKQADYIGGAVTKYWYDSVHNFTKMDVDGDISTFDSNCLNQYKSLINGSGTTNFTYDKNGNLTNDGTYKYYYDCENRLTDVNTVANARKAYYTYDYSGRRTAKTTYSGGVGTTTKYCYDGQQIIAEYDSAGTLIKKFIYGPGIDEPIMMIDASTANRYYYHYDGLGSVVALSNNGGSIVETYSYDVFGTPSGISSIGNPYLFTGRQYDSETGNYYYRARFYSPQVGRFLQTDPLRYHDSMNLYQYCMNNPVGLLDPYGLSVGAPGLAESMIPIWGSGRAAINDFQEGRYVWGTINTAMAVSDVFLVKAAVTGIAKGAVKGIVKASGSHTWDATRKWLTKTGWREFKGQEMHHWLLKQNSGIGKYVPDVIKNQPWNLMGMSSSEFHRALHGLEEMGVAKRVWYGTPDWAKAATVSGIGRVVNSEKNSDGCK